MPHLTSIADVTNEQLDAILDAAGRFKAGQAPDLAGRIACMAFFEPSTRTRLSFEAAAHRSGASVIGFADGQTTSTSKGETIADSARVLGGYADVIVMRHPETGSVAQAAQHARVPVVNAGDGSGEHPTQTLLDIFTMREALGDLKGRQVALIGDLANGRTVHSLAPALQRLGATVVQVPAPGLAYPGDLPTMTLHEAAATSDVLYATRVQKERASQGEAPRIDAALLDSTQSKAIVMHPLPRVDELAPDVDALSGAKYFEQARNGVPVRMAVLAYALDAL